MTKKESIFKEFKDTARINPYVAIAMIWVTIMPSLGSLFLVPWTVSQADWLVKLDFFNPITVSVALLVSILLMGFALMPTTLVAGLSGFFIGWPVFPWLVLGYTLATVLGYAWGKKVGGDSLPIILSRYPKAANLIKRKEGKLGELIFFVRISPVIPFALSNLLFALMRSGYWKIVLFGTLGMLPRTTLVFFSGTLASSIYTAIRQGEGMTPYAVFIFLLIFSIWGIWRFFTKKN